VVESGCGRGRRDSQLGRRSVLALADEFGVRRGHGVNLVLIVRRGTSLDRAPGHDAGAARQELFYPASTRFRCPHRIYI